MKGNVKRFLATLIIAVFVISLMPVISMAEMVDSEPIMMYDGTWLEPSVSKPLEGNYYGIFKAEERYAYGKFDLSNYVSAIQDEQTVVTLNYRYGGAYDYQRTGAFTVLGFDDSVDDYVAGSNLTDASRTALTNFSAAVELCSDTTANRHDGPASESEVKSLTLNKDTLLSVLNSSTNGILTIGFKDNNKTNENQSFIAVAGEYAPYITVSYDDEESYIADMKTVGPIKMTNDIYTYQGKNNSYWANNEEDVGEVVLFSPNDRRGYGTFNLSGYEAILESENATVSISYTYGGESYNKSSEFEIYALDDSVEGYSTDTLDFAMASSQGMDNLDENAVLIYTSNDSSMSGGSVGGGDINRKNLSDVLQTGKKNSNITVVFKQKSGSGNSRLKVTEAAMPALTITYDAKKVDNQDYIDTKSASLTWNDISSQSENNITADIKLPDKLFGADVTWVSDNREVMGNDGKLVADKYGDVKLTATLNYQGKTAVKDFDIKVLEPKAVIETGIEHDSDDGKTYGYVGITDVKNSEYQIFVASYYNGELMAVCPEVLTTTKDVIAKNSDNFCVPTVAGYTYKVFVWQNMKPFAYGEK